MIEKHAALDDDTEYYIPLFNTATKKTVKGLKLTGKELSVFVNALNAAMSQQALIDRVNIKGQQVREEESQVNLPPDEGTNPLVDRPVDPDMGYEGMQQWKPQPKKQNDNPFGTPTKPITDNPDNIKPPRL